MKITVKSNEQNGRRPFEHKIDVGDGTWEALCTRFGRANTENFVLKAVERSAHGMVQRSLGRDKTDDAIRRHLDDVWRPGRKFLFREDDMPASGNVADQLAAMKAERADLLARLEAEARRNDDNRRALDEALECLATVEANVVGKSAKAGGQPLLEVLK